MNFQAEEKVEVVKQSIDLLEIDISKIVEELTVIFSENELEVDMATWAALTSELSTTTHNLDNGSTAEVLGKAMDTVGILDIGVRNKIINVYSREILGIDLIPKRRAMDLQTAAD